MELYRAIADHYDEIFPLDPAQADFVAARVAPGGAILDAGCASGSLACALAARGFRVTGIDTSQRLVAKAVRRARPADSGGEAAACGGPRPEFRLMDMDLAGFEFPAASFDAVLCLGNTLPHLRGPAQIGHCLSGFRALLKESGVLIVQTIDFAEVAERGMAGLPAIENGAVRFERSYPGMEAGKPFDFETRLWIKPAPDPVRGETRLYALAPAELDSLLARSGFSSREAFASFSGAPGAVPLAIVVARP